MLAFLVVVHQTMVSVPAGDPDEGVVDTFV
jgi:hypothetical protein